MADERVIDLRAGERLRHIPAGRTLHLVDLENLVGGPMASPAEVALGIAAYDAVVRYGPNDHRVVACSKRMWATAKAAWPGALVKPVGRETDAADLALLAEARPSYVRRHFDRVVVASGDHIFGDLVVELDGLGLDTCVVATRRGLSRRLASVAPVVWYLEQGWSTVRATA